MFGLLYSTSKKKWVLLDMNEDKAVLAQTKEDHRATQQKRWEELTDEEKLLDAIFGTPVEYKIVRIEPAD